MGGARASEDCLCVTSQAPAGGHRLSTMSAVHRAEPSLLETALGALTRSSAATLEASNELLAHYSDTGDAPSQRAVNTLIDHAADSLRALTDSLTDIADELSAAAIQPAMTGARAATCRPAALRHPAAEGSSARPRPRRDQQA